ncbi:hypothetical protein TWF281_007685 [Arthrobotrys megalospora]
MDNTYSQFKIGMKNMVRGTLVPQGPSYLISRRTCPVVRIGPNELHINDPTFYNTIYAPNYKFPFYPPHYGFVGSLDATVAVTDPPIHKSRRAIWNRFFSKPQIQKLSSTLQENIHKFADLISEVAKRNTQEQGVHIQVFFRCLTLDIISEYAFSESLHTLHQGYDSPITEGVRRIIAYSWLLNFLWPFQYVLTALPNNIASVIAPSHLKGAVDLKKACIPRTNPDLDQGILIGIIYNMQVVGDQVEEFLHRNKLEKKPLNINSTRTTIFQSLMDGTVPGSSEKSGRPLNISKETLTAEAMMLLGAGMETTSSLLSNALYQACLNQSIQHKLHDELMQAFPEDNLDRINYTNCEKLPYLTAFIKENLRLTPPVPGRSPRVVPKDGTFCSRTYIPPDVSRLMHLFLYLDCSLTLPS